MRSIATRDCYANMATSASALRLNTTGNYNTADGRKALRKPTRNFNVGLDYSGGYELTTGGDNNIDVESQGLIASPTPFASTSQWLVANASESEESLKALVRSASSTQHTRFSL